MGNRTAARSTHQGSRITQPIEIRNAESPRRCMYINTPRTFITVLLTRFETARFLCVKTKASSKRFHNISTPLTTLFWHVFLRNKAKIRIFYLNQEKEMEGKRYTGVKIYYFNNRQDHSFR